MKKKLLWSSMSPSASEKCFENQAEVSELNN